MAEITLNQANFEQEVLLAQGLVLVDFWATWCGPCKMLSPVLAAFAEEKAGVLKVCKVNVDEQDALAERYHIESIPTLLLFRDGKLVKSAVGFRDKAQLEAMLA